MIKRLVLIFGLFMLGQTGFAYDELNLDFFAKFGDDCLVYYINTALENNHDLKKAEAVVEQYRQRVRYSLGAELPSFSVSADYLGVKIPRLDNFHLKENAFILPFSVNYEPDFLLKNRDKTRSAKKACTAALYEEKSVYISLLSDVATVYLNILQYDELIKIQEKYYNLRQKILLSDMKKFERGVIDSTHLNNSSQNLENAKNKLESLKKEQAELLMQLAVLSGISPEGSLDMKRGSFSNFEYQAKIPEEIPSDIIFSRPDVMKAEANLEKAKIDIRIARKEFLPSFNISGLWLFNTIAPGTFFSWDSSLALLFAGATQDIFTGGKKLANLRLQKTKYTELFEEYKQTDLNALKEVNTALCFIKHDKTMEENILSILNYEHKNHDNTKKKYIYGVVSKPEFLESEINLLDKEKDYTSAKTQRLVNYFTLYKASGGKL